MSILVNNLIENIAGILNGIFYGNVKNSGNCEIFLLLFFLMV